MAISSHDIPVTFESLGQPEILTWLQEEDVSRLEKLWQRADQVRRETVGDQVHVRGLLEISNHCALTCQYCGLRSGNTSLQRYRMSVDEIMGCVGQMVECGLQTVVLQSGDDPGLSREWLAALVRRIKAETTMAVTLSVGERSERDLAAWREAGADRYLLRFETSDAELYRRIHPTRGGRTDRMEILQWLRSLGYEVGSGVMVGIPGQRYASLAEDIGLFSQMDLDMIGLGPFLAHPGTPLGRQQVAIHGEGQQVPNTQAMTCKVLALTRLKCPEANMPSTTALATLGGEEGCRQGLATGANVVMVCFTPSCYRQLYDIYPGKACASDSAIEELHRLRACLEAMGRPFGQGVGGRVRRNMPDRARPSI